MFSKQKTAYFTGKETDEELKEFIDKSKPQRRVLFDLSRNFNWFDKEFADFLLLLTSNGFLVNKHEKPQLLYSDIKEFDILVLNITNLELSPVELRSINQFVEDGRGILIVGNQFGNTEQNFTMENMFGFSFEKPVKDELHHCRPDTDWTWAPP